MRSICSTKVGNQKACFGISAIQIGRAQVLHIASHPIATLWASNQEPQVVNVALDLSGTPNREFALWLGWFLSAIYWYLLGMMASFPPTTNFFIQKFCDRVLFDVVTSSSSISGDDRLRSPTMKTIAILLIILLESDAQLLRSLAEPAKHLPRPKLDMALWIFHWDRNSPQWNEACIAYII